MLLDIAEKSGEIRLIIQARGLVFEAKLDQVKNTTREKLAIGSRLAITGVYRIQRDEYGKPRSFLLNLRDGSDVRVLEPPPWWTLSRLLLVLAGVLLASLLAFLWTLETRRKNNLLLQAQVELKAAHDKLEERVRERTGNCATTRQEGQRSTAALRGTFRQGVSGQPGSTGVAKCRRTAICGCQQELSAADRLQTRGGSGTNARRVETFSQAGNPAEDFGRRFGQTPRPQPAGRPPHP